MISYDVEFRTTDSHCILDKENKRLNYAKDIIINNHVWICERTLILKGAHIESDSVIGASSLVNKSFKQSHVIIAGVPAKIIKTDINWESDRKKYPSN